MYNPNFKDSDYYKFYSELINDDTLMAAMKKYGYKGYFMLHPQFISQTIDFTDNDCFTIVNQGNNSLQPVIESSILVTDYSSIAFDFAYVKKPIIYCQFDADDFYKNHTYRKGYYDYEQHGFGPLCFDKNTAISTVI